MACWNIQKTSKNLKITSLLSPDRGVYGKIPLAIWLVWFVDNPVGESADPKGVNRRVVWLVVLMSPLLILPMGCEKPSLPSVGVPPLATSLESMLTSICGV